MDAVFEEFKRSIHEDKELPLPVASIQTLTQIIKISKASTMTELTMEIEKATHVLAQQTRNSIPVTAGCELFLRLLTRTALDVTVSLSCCLVLCLPSHSTTTTSHHLSFFV